MVIGERGPEMRREWISAGFLERKLDVAICRGILNSFREAIGDAYGDGNCDRDYGFGFIDRNYAGERSSG